MKKIFLMLLILIISALILVGCGAKTVISDENMTMTADENNGEVSGVYTDEENGTASYNLGANLQLPRTWPENDIPVYPGSEVVYSMEYQGDGSDSYSGIAFGTDDDLATVSSYYSDKLADATDASMANLNGMYMLGGEINGATYSIIITSDPESGWEASKDYLTYAIISLTYIQ